VEVLFFYPYSNLLSFQKDRKFTLKSIKAELDFYFGIIGIMEKKKNLSNEVLE